MFLRTRRRDGFTLFEILGAVTILAIVYSWLATSAMQGMRSEGLSKRRLEASLAIDEALMALETGLAAGVVPEIGSRVEQIDDFYRLEIDVAPFDPTPFLGEQEDAQLPPDAATSTLLMPPENPDQAFLRVVDIRLYWEEAGEEYHVRRTTLVHDQEQIAALFPETGEGAPPEEELTPEQEAAEAIQSGEMPPEELLEMLKGLAPE